MESFDITIVGAGVIGLAVARALSVDKRFAGRSIVILEQEAQFGQQISSRNSEVIHAGLYYPTNSLKADLCVRGKALLYDYFRQRQIAHSRCGKLVVAKEAERQALEDLCARAMANGVADLQLLSRRELRLLEPALDSDLALLSPSSGIVDSHGLMAALLEESEAAGVLFAPRTKLLAATGIGNEFIIRTEIDERHGKQEYQFRSRAVVNCAGLFADKIAAMFTSEDPDADSFQKQWCIHFCKGDYFSYTGPLRLQHLVYPLPEANTVGLGVHATLDLGGQIRFGPDTEFVDELNYDVDAGKAEKFARAIQSYLPSVLPEQLTAAYSGVRPKLSAKNEAAKDFVIASGNGEQQSNQLHLLGIESPGLTSSLAIAELICNRLLLP